MPHAEIGSVREQRRFLNKHLWKDHNSGDLSSHQFSLEQLQTIHSMFHIDEFMCPPHEHDDDDIENITYTLGPDYLAGVIQGVQPDEE